MKPMDPTAPDDQPKEQRILAAIVFTDVVGFSKLAATNEARVYTSLQRDMGVITSLCRAHSGQVLNTMGDGMLLCFTSAVDAMSCAVEVQRTLHAQAQSLPASDVLHHRIGVHLGDIIMSGDNVFGDGVNIAARLQAEAKPDAICFSKTVHEVVKNKLKLDAQYMAPRQLKNIGRVEIWQIPPIDEARKKAMQALIAAPLEPKKDVTGARGFKALSMILAAIVCLVALGIFIKLETKNGMPKDAKKASGSSRLHIKGLGSGVNSGSDDSGDASSSPTIVPTTAPNTGELAARLDSLKKSMAFDQVVAFLQGDGKAMPDSAVLLQTFSELVQMKQWVDSEVEVATYNNPVPATFTVNGSQVQASLYRGSSPGSYTLLNSASGETQSVAFADLGVSGIGAVVQSLISHPISQSQPSAPAWLAEFQRQYPE